MTETTNKTVRKAKGILYYDATCVFCRSGIDKIKNVLTTIDVEVRPFENGADEKEMILELRTGEIIAGADAALYLARRIPSTAVFGWFFTFPPMIYLARAAYRIIAKNRHCGHKGCRLLENEPPATGWLFATNLILTAVAAGLWLNLSGWIYMWTLAFAMWFGFKFMSYRRGGGVKEIDPLYFLWPGMSTTPFRWLRTKHGNKINLIVPAMFFTTGLAILYFIPNFDHPTAKGWAGVIAMLCLLHFGIFDFLAAFWIKKGYPVEPIMKNPWAAKGLGDFWGNRWNRAFADWARIFVFEPLTLKLGYRQGTVAGFFASGLAHELAISVPARGGFGLPTLYFLIQAAGLLIEKRFDFKRRGIARAWMWVIIILPAPILFHPPFIENVFNPMTKLITNLWNH